MCLLLVGVTLRMAPLIDDMGEYNKDFLIYFCKHKQHHFMHTYSSNIIPLLTSYHKHHIMYTYIKHLRYSLHLYYIHYSQAIIHLPLYNFFTSNEKIIHA